MKPVRLIDMAFYVSVAYAVGRLYQRQLTFERDVVEAFHRETREMDRWLRSSKRVIEQSLREIARAAR